MGLTRGVRCLLLCQLVNNKPDPRRYEQASSLNTLNLCLKLFSSHRELQSHSINMLQLTELEFSKMHFG